MAKYNHQKAEKKWREKWTKERLFVAKDASKQQKKYVLSEFPYPSGAGLHMGHLRPYVASDVYARYMRAKGFAVLYPMGWDAFGLPAENFAIKHGVQPAVSTAQNIKNAKKQIESWGISVDWAREVNTTDPKYYTWTQWIFLQLHKAGLAYEATGLIDWCPKDKTGLANEEVVGGVCERCGTQVEKKELRQWYLKITAYAEKLLAGLKNLDWPEQIKIQQENWIGRSEGALITFDLVGIPRQGRASQQPDKKHFVEVFTTRPDTIFGATFLVVSPELAKKWMDVGWKAGVEVKNYIIKSIERPEEDRTAVGKTKTGVFAGMYAINPASKAKIPVWIADYVLGNYGTGAVMAVPAHDERDFEFAKKFNLSVSDAPLVSNEDAMRQAGGVKKIQYKLRDWVFSRQRYWGEPIPMIHCERCGAVPVPEKDLPVKLPKIKKYQPTGTGESPLATVKAWVNVKCPKCKEPAKRETNTMPQWAGSSWYYLRYTDPKNKKAFAGTARLKRWLPVDVYFGGMEHTTLHLLYSRFWHLFLYDKKFVPTPEPYTKRVPHGIILGPDGEKMSKSRGNVVNPDDIVKQFGADTLRMYEMFLGPHEQTVSWKVEGIVGIKRFLDRVWKFSATSAESEISLAPSRKKSGLDSAMARPRLEISSPALVALHKTIKKVTEDIENFQFNTAISALMILLNEFEKTQNVEHRMFNIFLQLLAPFAPHMTEEIWRGVLGNKKSITLEKWPEHDPKLIAEDTFELIVQINGKVRDKFEAPTGISKEQAEKLTLAREHVKNILGSNQPKKVIFVPNRLINLVV